MKNKKIAIAVMLIAVILLISGISYAVWSVYFSQSSTNTITAKCFNTTFSEGNAITLTKTLPLSDADGMKNDPYTFTINNTCDLAAEYQINIEILDESTLQPEYVKISLNNQKSILSSNPEVTKTIANASKSYKIKEGLILNGTSQTFNLKTWLDYNTTTEQGANKIFKSKITIITTPVENPPILKLGEIGATETSKFLNSPITRAEIESIEFLDNKTIPNDVIGSWDVSEANDKSIMAWYKTGDAAGRYKVYIGTDGKIIANPKCQDLFANLKNLNTIKFNNNFDTSQVTTMAWMFVSAGYNNLDFTLDVSNLNTSKVTNMSGMFSQTGYNNPNFALNVSNFDTSNVIDMNSMFKYVGYNNPNFTLDVSNLNTSKVTNAAYMFYQTGYNSKILTLDVSNFDTSNMIIMNSMFEMAARENTKFTLDVSNFNTSKVTNMGWIFRDVGYNNPNFTLDVSNFDTSKVTNMNGMFYYAGCDNPNFKLNLKNMTFPQVVTKDYMFQGIKSTSTIYVKDATAESFVKSTLNFPAGVTVVNCSTNSCP